MWLQIRTMLFLVLPLTTQSANILGIFTALCQSHIIVHIEMMKVLATQGHNITLVTVHKPPVPVPDNIHHLLIPAKEGSRDKFKQFMGRLSRENKSHFDFFFWNEFYKFLIDVQSDFLTDPRWTALYENPQNEFDLVFVGYFINLYQLGVAAKFRCPLIMNWIGGQLDQMDSLSGNPSELSYVPPFYLPTQPGEKINFIKRLHSFLSYGFKQVLMGSLSDIRMQHHYNRVFAGESKDFPSYQDVRKNISLIFSNYYSIGEGPIRPLVPSFVEVGGLQAKEKPDVLPKDIASFIDNAKDGVILLSLGTNVQDSFIKPHSIRMLYERFSQMKERVIWKWEDLESIPGNAKNILYKQWLAQDDILAHPNVKLFITHAGKGGIAEAQYHGVPMLAFPFFGDQFGNAEVMVKSGFGLSLTLQETTGEALHETLKELLENKKYTEKIQKYAELYRDRPLTARQSVIYWTEYVLRHKGAYHLQSPAIHLNFVQRHNLDILLAILLIIFTCMWMLKLLTNWIVAKFKRRNVKEKSS